MMLSIDCGQATLASTVAVEHPANRCFFASRPLAKSLPHRICVLRPGGLTHAPNAVLQTTSEEVWSGVV